MAAGYGDRVTRSLDRRTVARLDAERLRLAGADDYLRAAKAVSTAADHCATLAEQTHLRLAAAVCRQKAAGLDMPVSVPAGDTGER